MSSEIPANEQPPRERRSRASGQITGALILITIGVVFLLQQTTGFMLRNWWALFILIPAVGSFGTAFALFQRSGRLTYGVLSAFYGGLFPLAVALMFLFELDWGLYWPIFVILPGFGALVSGLVPGAHGEPVHPLARRLFQPWGVWIGLSATLLGVTFLLYNLDVFDPADYLKNWWGAFILLVAAGGLISTIRLAAERGGFNWVVTVNLVVSLVIGAVGIVALLGVNWNLLGAIVLIGAGVAILVGFVGRGREEG